jgi:hypothetical protein
MADVQKNFASIVALGSQNPQILNEDFLKNNKIIPADQAPFEKCTNFVSTPPFVTIGFGPIEILVDEQRFQIREAGLSDWNTSIFNIAMNYYSILKYTPVSTVGLNLHCQIDFENVEESEGFQKLLLPEKSKIVEIISKDNVDISIRLRYPHTNNGRMLVTIDRTVPEKLQRKLSFNYEFDCLKNGQTNWPIVEAELSNINNMSDYFSDIINKLLEAI